MSMKTSFTRGSYYAHSTVGCLRDPYTRISRVDYMAKQVIVCETMCKHPVKGIAIWEGKSSFTIAISPCMITKDNIWTPTESL